MKVAAKITVVMLLATVAAFAAMAVIEVRRQVEAYELRIAGDLFDLGRGLGHAYHEVARNEGRERALEVLRYADERLHEVNIRYVSLDPAEGTDPHVPRARLAEVAAGREQMVVARDEDHGNGILYTYVPIEDTKLGALEIAQSLAKETEFRRHAFAEEGFAALVTAIISTVLASIVGLYFVGRPMQRLVAQARRVGAGDLGERLAIRQRDEIGELAGEMNAMCDRLEAARDEAQASHQERLATLEQLRHADRLMTVGKLASGIAHELGTPLNVVSGRATMLAENLAAEGAADHARIIRQQAERMAKIIRHLLDFARRREPRRVETDLRQIARQTLSLVATLAQKNNVTLELEPPSCDGAAFVDPMQMEQVISNLVVNGIQAMEGGGTLAVKLVREVIAPPGEGPKAARPCLSIVVRDEGRGIAPDNVERVFEPFFTTKGVGEGTGLGLSVAYGIVLDHGGWITVESHEAKGSTFAVHLPEAAEERKTT